ncbi:phenylalanine--tRNA ligase subunit beta [Prosthecodimorpha staleyi]|uniref:Phenylalanine--tRNA ligase beta subunit n=1 Tax=Prosthecodimorpha staleyi TaxID=2840188 RepID=A0A947D7M3_9HYPH|nr:phenylalanine--tRNA ligase subunit beta [Prosthecodimorpha staleyi]MBT9292456.1 phenylalanine--tRNA ligase subunit beta [Prosthecodimorpha staleyi]
MKFTLSWLKDHLDTGASLDQIVEALTAVGLEVEGVEDKAKQLRPFTVAYVVSAVQHPNADRLRVCMVDTGEGEPVQVVCGAPNARTGMKSVFSPPGTYIPGKDITLGVGTIRGVESRGMLCSAAELQLSEDHDGIIELPADAPVGMSYVAYADLDDPVIDVSLTPNRADCTGVRGIARDLAAADLGTLKPEPSRPIKGLFVSPQAVALEFPAEGPVVCPAFYGRTVRGVKNGPSPDWMQKRLRAVGLRPINALVDITNYISLDQGRPLHVYDADKLTGTIRARLGRDGESFLALDGKTYAVDPRMCVIADDRAVLGFGGIMGGEDTGCSEETRNVFIECAYFDPLKTAETGRRTGIVSDARYRFERGVDPAYLGPGIELATRMVMDLCGGEPSEVVRVGTPPETDRVIRFPLAEVKRLSGLDLHWIEVKHILERLGFLVVSVSDEFRVSPPSWRNDIHGKADLVEEIVRIHGLDKVPLKPLDRAGSVGARVLTTAQIRRSKARRTLAARGMLEAVTWSFVSKAQAELFGGGKPELALANPIASDLSDMRPSLLAGLITAAQRNADRGIGDVALFEVGQAFRGDRPKDQRMLISGIRRGNAVMTGAGRHWTGAAPDASWLDAKADAVAVLEALGAPVERMQLARTAPGWFHPGRSAVLQLGPQNVIAAFGELHPRTLEALDVSGPLVAFEIDLDAIPEPKARPTRSKGALAVADLLPVRRDFAFVVEEAVEADRIVKATRNVDKALVADVAVFDVFRGAALGENRKSVAVEVTLQPQGKTMTDAEIDAVAKKIVAAVAKATGAALRA